MPTARLRRTFRWTLVPVLIVVVMAAASCTIVTPPLQVTTVLANLTRPWDIAFASDGTMLFTERVGRINAVIGGVKRTLATPVDVFSNGEAGLMGLAVDPAFASNRRIYTCFASTLPAGATNDVRVVRWTVDAGYTALANRTDILTGGPVSTGRHAGCRVRFGPDGHLWVTMGDAAVNTHPQSPTSLGGKVLRITTSGAGAPGNPGGALRPEIYTYGHRNPQGIAFRPSDGQAFEIEHGTDRDDEINVLVPGGNYGWDPVPPGGGSVYDESQPMTDLTKFPAAIPAIWSSGLPTIAPSGGTFITGSAWGPWDGKLAVAVLKDQKLQVFGISPANAFVNTGIAVTDQGRLRIAVQGPDGSLYLSTDSDAGKIVKITPG